MSKFWQKKYTSKYTGKEIDDAIGQVIEGGGGGGVLVVTLTFNEATETVSCDKTFNEISAAFASKTPMFLIPPEDATIIPVQYYASEEQIVITQNFIMTTDIGGTPYAQISVFNFTITPDNAVTYEENTVMCAGTTS